MTWLNENCDARRGELKLCLDGYVLQTKLWSALLTRSKVNLLIQGCGEGKCSIYCKAPNMGPSEENGHLMLKRPKLPYDFWEKVFKGKVGERVSRCLISLWIFFSLVGSEVIGWYFESQRHQPSGSRWSESTYWWSAVNFLHLLEVLVAAKQFKGMTQNIIYSFLGELKVLDFVL